MSGDDFRALLAALGRRPDERIAIGYKGQWELTKVADAPGLVRPVNQHFTAFPFSDAVVPPGRGKQTDTIGIRSVGIDFDYNKASKIRCLKVRKAIEAETGVMAAALVDSGHGQHAHYKVEPSDWSEPGEALQAARDLVVRWDALVERIASAYGVEVDKTRDIARCWRVPGSMNRKKVSDPVPVRLPFAASHPEQLTDKLLAGLITDVSAEPWQSDAGGVVVGITPAFDTGAAPCAYMQEILDYLRRSGSRKEWQHEQFDVMGAMLVGHRGGQAVLDEIRRRWGWGRSDPYDSRHPADAMRSERDGWPKVTMEKALIHHTPCECS